MVIFAYLLIIITTSFAARGNEIMIPLGIHFKVKATADHTINSVFWLDMISRLTWR